MHLEKKNLKVQDLEKDFSDGVKLIALLEILHGKKIEGRYYKNPKSKPYMIDNVNFALNMITDVFGVKLIQCSAEGMCFSNLFLFYLIISHTFIDFFIIVYLFL